MKKSLLSLVGAVLALLLALYLVAAFGLGSIVRTQIVRRGHGLTQTPVALSAAELSPFSGSGTLFDLSVGNTKGWSQPEAFRLKEIHVTFAPKSVFSHEIVIDEIVIDQPELVYETKLVSSNIGDLVKSIKKSADAGSKGKPEDEEPATTFIIKKLRLQNGRLKFGVGPTAVTLTMPAVEFHNLGTAGKGLSADQVGVYVMKIIATSVVDTATHAVGSVGTGLGTAGELVLKGSFAGLKAIIP